MIMKMNIQIQNKDDATKESKHDSTFCTENTKAENTLN